LEVLPFGHHSAAVSKCYISIKYPINLESLEPQGKKQRTQIINAFVYELREVITVLINIFVDLVINSIMVHNFQTLVAIA
jgi:hypothetical protein